jgi:hypothetical protein
LPLNLQEISLPDPVLRTLDRDYYDEYIEIAEIFDQGMSKYKINHKLELVLTSYICSRKLFLTFNLVLFFFICNHYNVLIFMS